MPSVVTFFAFEDRCSYPQNAANDIVRKMNSLLCIAGLILIAVHWGESLKCYECMYCDTVTSADLVECPAGTKACSKKTLLKTGGVARECEASYAHSGCRDISAMGLKLRSCLCNTDYCNAYGDMVTKTTGWTTLVTRLSTTSWPKVTSDGGSSQKQSKARSFGTSAATTAMAPFTKPKSLKCYQCYDCNTVTPAKLIQCPATAQACSKVIYPSGLIERTCSDTYDHYGCRDRTGIETITTCLCGTSECNGDLGTTTIWIPFLSRLVTTTMPDVSTTHEKEKFETYVASVTSQDDIFSDPVPQLIRGLSDILKTVSDMLRLLSNKLY